MIEHSFEQERINLLPLMRVLDSLTNPYQTIKGRNKRQTFEQAYSQPKDLQKMFLNHNKGVQRIVNRDIYILMQNFIDPSHWGTPARPLLPEQAAMITQTWPQKANKIAASLNISSQSHSLYLQTPKITGDFTAEERLAGYLAYSYGISSQAAVNLLISVSFSHSDA